MAIDKVWVLAEAGDNGPTPITLELLTEARAVAGTVEVVAWGSETAALAVFQIDDRAVEIENVLLKHAAVSEAARSFRLPTAVSCSRRARPSSRLVIKPAL